MNQFMKANISSGNTSDVFTLKDVTAQVIRGQGFSMDLDENGAVTLKATGQNVAEPYRIIDGHPVYHACKNPLPEGVAPFDVKRLHLFGEIYHPFVILASECIGGTVKFYIDTRFPGIYLLWTATRVDYEFPGVSRNLVAWTPKTKGDTIKHAAVRLFHAVFINMVMVDEGKWHCDPQFAEGFEGWGEVADIMGAVAPTVHESKEALDHRVAQMPPYLQSLYREGATVGSPTCTYSYK
jgi:hypothetical protein